MRSLTRSLLVCVVSALQLSAATVQNVVDDVSQASYGAWLGSLFTHAGDNRGLGSAQHDLARDYIDGSLQGMGLATTLHSFTYNGGTYQNVVATLPGTVNPDLQYVVGGHYDSVGNPGADDDASGVAGMLEAARVLSNYQFAATIVFIAFDCEEVGLVGSSAYAGAAAARGDNIQGMISLDMIAYAGANPDKANIYWAQDNSGLTAQLQGALNTYGGIAATVGKFGSSDHVPFDTAGYAAALLIEFDVWSNPHYHSPLDSIDTAGYIDDAYATRMTQGVVGYLATAAVLVPEPGTAVLFLVGAWVAFRRRSR